MYIIIKNNTVYKTSVEEISEQGLITIQRPEFTKEEQKLLGYGAEINENGEVIETIESKKNAMLSDESILDFIFTIASVLDAITSDNPNQEIITEAKNKFNAIKNILKK